jgi:hypothetical protein
VAQKRPGAACGARFKLSRCSAESLPVADRKRVRPDPDRPVEVQVMGPDDLDVLYARDISEAGIGVFMPHGFDASRLHAQVELIVHLPDTSPFVAAGILRHRTVNGPLAFFGVEFTRVADSARQSLRSYVQARLAAEAASKAPTPRTVAQ